MRKSSKLHDCRQEDTRPDSAAQRPLEKLPETVDEAVAMLMERLGDDDKAWLLRYARGEEGYTTHLRMFAMFVHALFDVAHNRPLLRSCGGERMWYEEAGAVIIERLLDVLRETQ